jgi:CheY-like chemotaxis protein
MLPDVNGLAVCRELRNNHLLTPILFLTALGTSENIVVGLNTGADDYLVKPFNSSNSVRGSMPCSDAPTRPVSPKRFSTRRNTCWLT